MKFQKVSVIAILSILLMALLLSCGSEKAEVTDQTSTTNDIIFPHKKINLWNGKDFNGWDRFVLGKDVDVNTVWMVKNGILHCTGVPNGYIKTANRYANYKLTVEWRWPAEPGNSGVLLHMREPDYDLAKMHRSTINV